MVETDGRKNERQQDEPFPLRRDGSRRDSGKPAAEAPHHPKRHRERVRGIAQQQSHKDPEGIDRFARAQKPFREKHGCNEQGDGKRVVDEADEPTS
jgi:hypothetical protein